MKKLLLILVLGTALFSQTEARCKRADIASLKHKGFSTTEINRICGISHKSKHKKTKKHHKRSASSRTRWLPPVPKAICAKYTGSTIVGKGLCNARYKDARKICRAMGGRLPTERELLHSCDSCTHIVPVQRDATYIYDPKVRFRYEKCTGRLGFKIGRAFWSSTSSRASGRIRVVNFPIEPNFTADHNGMDEDILSYDDYVRCVAR